MKYTLLLLIILYQKTLSAILKNILGVQSFCRFNPTCSEYARASIKEKGVLIGGYDSFVRILKCQPFYKGT